VTTPTERPTSSDWTAMMSPYSQQSAAAAAAAAAVVVVAAVS